MPGKRGGGRWVMVFVKRLSGSKRWIAVALGLSVVAGPAFAADVTRTVTYSYPTYSSANGATALVSSETLEPGNANFALTTSFTYDAKGNRLTTTVSGGNVASRRTETTYDASGRFPATSKSARLTATPTVPSLNAAQQTVSFTYDDKLGLVTSQTRMVDATNSVSTRFHYDGWGRKTHEIGPDLNGVKTEYFLCSAPSTAMAGYSFDAVVPAGYTCPTGSPYHATHAIRTTPGRYTNTATAAGFVPNGPESITYYNALNNVVRSLAVTFDGAALQWTVSDTTYDQFGRVWVKYQPIFNAAGTTPEVTYEYDAFNRPRKATTGDGQFTLSASTNPPAASGGQCFTSTGWNYVWTGCYAETTTTDQLNRVTKTRRNSQGKVIREVNPAGGITLFGYEPFGNVAKVTTAEGRITTAAYNVRGWRTVLTDPDRGTWSWFHDALGQVAVQADARGLNTFYWYDSIGRMVSRWAPDASLLANTGIQDVWIYDTGTYSLGKEVAAHRWTNDRTGTGWVLQYTRYSFYDAYQRPSSTQEQTDAQLSYLAPTIFTYNADGRVATKTSPSGLKLQYTYSVQNNFLVSIVDGDSPTTVFWAPNTIDAAGRITSDTIGATTGASQFKTTRAFDTNRGWMTSTDSRLVSGNTARFAQTIGRDVRGNVTSRATNSAALAGTLSETATYDSLDRMLTLATTPASGAAVPTKSFTYSGDGNITSKSDVGSYTYGSATTRPHAVTAAGGASYSYDANGNVVLRGGKAFTYTNANMPEAGFNDTNTTNINAALAWWSYNTGNRRSKQVSGGTTTRYYGSGMWRENTATSIRLRDYITTPGGGTVEVLSDSTGGPFVRSYYALLPDYQGSMGAYVSIATGNIVEPRSYDGWGRMRQAAGQDDNAANAVLNASTEPTGFIGQEHVKGLAVVNLNARLYDPIIGRFLAADPLGDYGTQGLNPYSYARNNPLTGSDPTGLRSGDFLGNLLNDINVFLEKHQRAVIAIAAVAMFQFQFAPGALAAAGVAEAGATFATLPAGLQVAVTAASGALGGAINTGTLRGTIVGAATSVAFWGVGQASGSLLPQGVPAGAIKIGLHAAVGCASSAAGGGQCGSGALSAGFAKLTTLAVDNMEANHFIKGAITALGGGTGAALSGGRLGDGLLLGAMGYSFNAMGFLVDNGNEVHRAFEEYASGREFYALGLRFRTMTDQEGSNFLGFPDTFSRNLREVWDLKPNTPGGWLLGFLQISRYTAISGYLPGGSSAFFSDRSVIELRGDRGNLYHISFGMPGILVYERVSEGANLRPLRLPPTFPFVSPYGVVGPKKWKFN